jgi:DnaJ-class molecular chaperone
MARIMSKTTYNKSQASISTQDSISLLILSDSRKGATLNLKIPVSIEDLFNGTTVKAVFETKEACTKCMGTGAESSKNLQNCNVCGSRGFSIINGRNMYGQPQKFEGICPHCQGSGKIVTKQCPVCHGKKILDKVKTIEVEIPAKFQGKEIKLRNYGPEQQLGAPSDFLVQI